MSQEFLAQLGVTESATPTAACANRLREHLLAVLLNPERSTLTNLICTSGRAQQDWSAAYRLYARQRANTDVLFASALGQLLERLPPQAPLVVALDDTLVRRRGTHIDGVAWRRDPLGPAFQTNLVRGQRYLQFSAAWPLQHGQARLLPIGFFHAPSAPKPPKQTEATPEACATAREQCKQQRLNAQALTHMRALRAQVEPGRRLLFCGDGSYTNATVLKHLPPHTVYLGRLRKDAALHHLPEAKAPEARGGRPRFTVRRRPRPRRGVRTRTCLGRRWRPLPQAGGTGSGSSDWGRCSGARAGRPCRCRWW